MKRPAKRKMSGDQRANILSRIAGQLRVVDISGQLRRAEAPKAHEAFRAFMSSLDGAIRHAQRQRHEEESAAESATLVWQPAKVGCYWNAGPFTIGTISGPEVNGYELVRDFKRIGFYTWLDEAKGVAQQIWISEREAAEVES